MKNITCISVCVNYADFLSQTIKGMKVACDEVIIITSSRDKDTQKLCQKHDVAIYETDIFWQDGAAFAKGKAIHEVLRCFNQELKDSWILHLDSDILIQGKIPKYQLVDDECIYGCPRTHRLGQTRSLRQPSSDELHYAFDKKSPGKTRRTSIFRPVGFFQLWKFSMMPCYPHCSDNAAIDDVIHASSFSKTKILNNFCVTHLLGNNERPFSRKNWNGRSKQKIN